MRAGRSKLDVAEAFAADFRQGDLDAALVADHSAVLHPLVFAAQAFPVGDRAENLCAEQSVTLGLERTVVDGLRLGDFTVRPRTNFLRAGQADTDRIKISDQTCAIIGAAAIQGCFLPALAFRREPRSGPFSRTRPAENPNKETQIQQSC